MVVLKIPSYKKFKISLFKIKVLCDNQKTQKDCVVENRKQWH
jgi:hypothetical protein